MLRKSSFSNNKRLVFLYDLPLIETLNFFYSKNVEGTFIRSIVQFFVLSLLVRAIVRTEISHVSI